MTSEDQGAAALAVFAVLAIGAIAVLMWATVAWSRPIVDPPTETLPPIRSASTIPTATTPAERGTP